MSYSSLSRSLTLLNASTSSPRSNIFSITLLAIYTTYHCFNVYHITLDYEQIYMIFFYILYQKELKNLVYNISSLDDGDGYFRVTARSPFTYRQRLK